MVRSWITSNRLSPISTLLTNDWLWLVVKNLLDKPPAISIHEKMNMRIMEGQWRDSPNGGTSDFP